MNLMPFASNTIRLDNTINGYLCSVRNADRAARSSERRNNVVSWISEIKSTSNVTVRKKRGRRAPPSTKRLREKKVDEEIGSDDAVDNDINDTDEGQADTNQSDVHSEEHVDGRTSDGLQKSAQSGNASDGPSSAAEEQGNLTNSKDVIKKVQKKLKMYCMRVMMEDVPEKEWLCEDCETMVESEKEKKLEKSQAKVGTSKGQSFQGEMNKAAKNRSSDSELVAQNVDNNESDTANKGNDMVKNRMEASSIRYTISETGDAYMGADTRKRMSSSRESSFGYDADKGKQPSQVGTSLTSNAPKNQAPQPRGKLLILLFSDLDSLHRILNVQFMVPKVKQLLNEVPQKPKSLKESWSSILKKEAPISMTTKSATFKKPKPPEPANKAKSSISPPAEEPKLANQLGSQNLASDQCSSILGTPSTTSVVAPAILKIDTTAQPLATGNNTADLNNLGTAHLQGGNSEQKKPLLAKVPESTVLPNTERSLGGILGAAQRKVIQNLDPSHRDAKIKDPAGFRQGASSSNRLIRCQRCNEPGHSTQFCAVDKLRVSAVKPLSDRNLKDASAKRNRTSETNTSAATEKAASRSGNQSEQILKCGTYQSPVYGPKDVLPASLGHLKKPSPLSAPGSTASVDYSKLKFKDDYPTLSATTVTSADNGRTMPSDRRDESAQAFSTGDEPMASTRTGRSPELCDGFQAHLSCSASQLVLEVAKKFPSKVQLEEVPRQNSWPTQFQENGPTYNDVGLFFFARDIQSYESHYSKLVENMLKNDLILRGSVGAVELLILPSNILSKNFQISRKDCSNLPTDKLTSGLEPNFNEDPRAPDPSTSVLSSSLSFSKDRDSFAKQNTSLLRSANYVPSLEGNPGKPDVKTSDTFRDTVSERDFDVNMVSATCSVSLTHQEEPGKESTTINLNDAEDFMDIDHVNTDEISTVAMDSHASGGGRKRSFDTANGAAEVDEVLEHKKVKLDNVGSTNSGLSDNSNNGRLSSKVHPLAASIGDDVTSNKSMAEASSADKKCVFPLDLNAVDDTASENIVNIPSSDDEELQARGNNRSTDITGQLSLSLAFPSRKEQDSNPQSEPQRQFPSNKNNTSSVWGQQ
ncbi:hypothetical protein HU200_055322 [Digitaria exilis]|uniref:AIPP2-like SPOC-like domain-containing protein n=1 Tax=Digitaria exilis TaxID=1010633 RepID=A0A835AJ30_9POAL|nr:hypothetical protein HU200_055322 [Digitaria exilis]